MWKQVREFDVSKSGTVATQCLANTRKGFSIPAKYDDAWSAWLSTEQHEDRNFPALYVPVYFSYTTTLLVGGKRVTRNFGHIGVRFPDGRFWTDGRMFASVEAYDEWGKPVFVGWGESINDVRVIIEEGEGSMALTAEAIDMAFKMAGQNSKEADYKYYKNKPEELIRNLWGSSGTQRWALWGDKPLPDPNAVTVSPDEKAFIDYLKKIT